MKKFLILVAFSVLAAGNVRADGTPADSGSSADLRSGAEKVGADASVADRRLPPVFPGEEVRDGKKTIKTWSTSGAVPVSRPPEPWKEDTNYGLRLNNGLSVVVDGRNPSAPATSK